MNAIGKSGEREEIERTCIRDKNIRSQLPYSILISKCGGGGIRERGAKFLKGETSGKSFFGLKKKGTTPGTATHTRTPGTHTHTHTHIY